MLFCLLLAACSQGGAEAVETADHTLTGHMDLTYAEQFKVDYYSDGTSLITIHDEFPFLLVPEGVSVSEETIGDAVVLQQPLHNIYQASSAMMDPFIQIEPIEGGTG